MSLPFVAAWAVVCAGVVAWPLSTGYAQSPRLPSARLIPAPAISFPSDADSNSPAVWELVDGVQRLFLLTSVAGQATRHAGAQLSRLISVGEVLFANHPGHGVWFESIVADVDGTWYGFYHHEQPAQLCAGDHRTIPRIGAARSEDLGITWQDLGVILESQRGSHACGSTNTYFVGGVGDFSVVLDLNAQYLYFFFSQYSSRESTQGVSVARLAWADRDAPGGKMAVWLRERTWLPAHRVAVADAVRPAYPAGSPIYPVTDGWHDDTSVDAFWGPSVHYNTYLRQYVMLLNRAKDAAWSQEGIYVEFNATLEDSRSWSKPQRLLAGGRWYPQVQGTEAGVGTDKVAGERARFFMGGRSDYLIQFSR